MLEEDSTFVPTLLDLPVVDINLYVEIDTRDGYEYHKVFGYRLDKSGSLSAILSDTRNPNSFRYVLIAKPSGLKKMRERAV